MEPGKCKCGDYNLQAHVGAITDSSWTTHSRSECAPRRKPPIRDWHPIVERRREGRDNGQK